MTRRAVLPSRVIPSPGRLCKSVAKIVFGTLVSETAKCLKSVNSFGPTVFFVGFVRSSLSIRVVKSKNEFAAAEILSTTEVGHVTDFFLKKSNFCWNSKIENVA